MIVNYFGIQPNDSMANEQRNVDGDQVEVCRIWLRLFAKQTRGLQRDRSSYSLKHMVEKWIDDFGPDGVSIDDARSYRAGYISNGSFIIAALTEGYEAKRTEPRSPNAYFNFLVLEAAAAP